MATILSKVREFIPTVGGNDKKAEADRIVVNLKAVDVYVKQVQLRKFLSMSPEEVTKSMMEDKGSKEIKDLLFKQVASIDNFTVIGEDKSERNGTIQDMWDLGEFEFCLEVFNDILSHSQLKKAEAKNSESQSGSTPTPVEAIH